MPGGKSPSVGNRVKISNRQRSYMRGKIGTVVGRAYGGRLKIMVAEGVYAYVLPENLEVISGAGK